MFSSISVKQPKYRSQLRSTERRKPVGDSPTVAVPRSGRRPHQASQQLKLPVDIAFLMYGVIDLQERVGLAAHRSVTQEGAENERPLRFRQTSHGITLFLQFYMETVRAPPL